MKRIITCSDGTWNRPGQRDQDKEVLSNVQLMYNLIKGIDDTVNERITQVKFYETGVGSSSYNIRDRIFGGIAGNGIDEKIKDLYTFISLNYEIGDELYLFGFSRGSYTARSLAGFIRNCGILKPKFLNMLDKAYEIYRNRNDYTSPDSDMMKSFRKKYSVEENIIIKFIGVWDTVGSLGIPINKTHNLNKFSFHDVKLSSTIENAYHALAIDERRNLFQPTLWEISPQSSNIQNVEQRWFIGVHCNVGGGYADNGLSDIPLAWLIEKAKNIGLKMNPPDYNNAKNKYEYKINYSGILRDSRTSFYKFLPASYRNFKDANKRINAEGNPIITNETFDESIAERMKLDKSYKHQLPTFQ